MREMVKELESFGYIRRNIRSRYASPVHVVRKPDGRGFRMTVDLGAVNEITIPVAWPMPVMEVALTQLAGSSYFAVFDAFKGY